MLFIKHLLVVSAVQALLILLSHNSVRHVPLSSYSRVMRLGNGRAEIRSLALLEFSGRLVSQKC